MSDFDYRILKSNGFSDRDIKFIVSYAGEEYLNKIIKKLKKLNALEAKKSQKEAYQKRLENDKKYKFQSQCKHVVGYAIINKLIEESIINNYDEILVDVNELSPKMKEVINNILSYIEDNLKNWTAHNRGKFNPFLSIRDVPTNKNKEAI